MDDQRKEDPILKPDEVGRLLEFLQEAPGTIEGEHLTEDDLASYGEGNHGEADTEWMDRHLASCEICAIRMEGKLKILVLAAEECRASFDLFLTRMEPGLKRLMARYHIPSEDREDVLQQALLTLLYQWDRVRDPEDWLLGTLKRNCLMYWRMHRRRIYSSVDAALLEWLSEPVAASQERSDLLSEIDSLIERLPPRCRSLLRLRFRLGYEPPEVARRLGYRTSSIGKITSRCLAALAREMLASGLAERFSEPGRPAAPVDVKGGKASAENCVEEPVGGEKRQAWDSTKKRKRDAGKPSSGS